MQEMFTQQTDFETVFRNSKDGLAIFKGDIFVDCNQSMLDIVGADSLEQFVGNTPAEFSPEYQPDGRRSDEKSAAHIEQCYQLGSVRFEWVHKKRNGEEFWAEVILTKMVLNGEVVVHTNWRDISEKKAFELELQSQKSVFETLFNESSDGLALLTKEKLLDCNKAYMQLFGAADKAQILDADPEDLSPHYQPDGRAYTDKATEVINTAYTQGKVSFEWVHRKFDGTEFWCEIILLKIELQGQDVLYATTRDISEKKSLQLEIAKQKEAFETLFNESLDGLCLLTTECYFDCNKAFVQMFDAKDKNQIIGATPMDLSPFSQPDGSKSLDKAQAIIRTAFTQGKIRFEWVHKKFNGTEFWCEIILFRISLNGKDVLYASTRDISEKKALQLEIAKQKEAFETLFNESLDGLCLLTTECYFDCNKAFVQMFDAKDKNQIIGATPMDLSPFSQPDGSKSLDKAQAIIRTAFTQGKIRFEWVHKKFNGTEFWCEIILFRISLNGKDVLYASTRDISEKKALQLEIARQKDSFETLFAKSMDGLSILAEEGYQDCNEAFLALYGFTSKEEVIGLSPLDLSPEFQFDGKTSEQAAEGIIDKAFSEGSQRFEWLHKKTDGTLFWCEIILTRITLNERNVLYTISRDISEKKALETKINERNEQLNESNKNLEESLQRLNQTKDKLVEAEKMASLGSLVAGVAHEINTPVGVGLTGISQLNSECDEIKKHYQAGTLTADDFEDFIDSAGELSGLVQKNLERTASLVRSFKQVAVDQTSEQDREVNLKQYFEEVVTSLASVLRKSQARVNIDCADNFIVKTNPGLLAQVLTNFIVNSVVHGFADKGSGTINIAVSEITKTEFLIDYRDDGVGIEETHVAKIFEPFFTTKRGSGGTGLGLNIAYNIITNALKGSVVCSSKRGHGVQFNIHFEVSARIA
ncbi:PAS domain-containing protein [Alteromonas lipolytica]|uniref:histidine kinase n=1 Tax=Alteromonas lipolytica TaxID=1856405 RepID=A0A1E8FE36_9ALTE|nr:PAS domain-containing protein [Alteromonas lipolytica]OFI34179.1 hypothetical protein BFC17_21825 [Alteromonas lipolytica]GGF84343.1 hypothetical protein GCM10011338_40850 [Alteromonas lipolytica]